MISGLRKNESLFVLPMDGGFMYHLPHYIIFTYVSLYVSNKPMSSGGFLLYSTVPGKW